MRGLGPPQKRQLLRGKGAAADKVKPCFLQKNTANQKARRDVAGIAGLEPAKCRNQNPVPYQLGDIPIFAHSYIIPKQ